jgi:hypothetical protein
LFRHTGIMSKVSKQNKKMRTGLQHSAANCQWHCVRRAVQSKTRALGDRPATTSNCFSKYQAFELHGGGLEGVATDFGTDSSFESEAFLSA